MILVDSHCHLGMSESTEGEILGRARAAGVRGFLVPGTHGGDAPEAVAVARRHPDVWAAVGYHPHEAKDFDGRAEQRIRELAKEPRVIGIGEVGLDYHYMHSPREVQRDVLLRHVAIAREANLPLIIHNRESTDDLLAILESSDAAGARGVLHSFTETYDVAKRLVDRGFFISFSGILTFRTAEALRDAASRLPREAVLIETDTPYLAPAPHRGKKNEPAFVVEVARRLASLWGCDLDEVAARTTANFERAFDVKIGA
ncbi:MAG TPA: TatD family hydrolase [Thermoanaerobaculia bacterium]